MSSEPQSIIHQVLRLEHSLRRVVSSRCGRSRRSRKALNHVDEECREFAVQEKPMPSEDFTESTLSVDSLHSSCTHHSHSSLASLDSINTMNQNEFMTDVMIEHATDEVAFVHFFIEGSKVSEAIDEQMQKLEQRHPSCKFARIDVAMAPYVVRMLKTSSDKPAVVALKNGKLMNRICDFDTAECSELDNWMYTVLLMRLFQ